MSLVYLAGGIAKLSGEAATNWRLLATKVLFLHGIDTRDPMRAKSALSMQKEISANFHDYENNGVFFTSRAIMTRDFNDVKQCDALLVNLLGAQVPSLGTIMELAWAYALRKPAIVVIERSGNVHDNHPMITEAMSFRVTTLADGIAAVATVLGVQADV